MVRLDLVVEGIKTQALAFVHGETEKVGGQPEPSSWSVEVALGVPQGPPGMSACAAQPAPVPHLAPNPRESQCSTAFLRWRLQKQALPRDLLIVHKGQAEALPALLHGGPERYLELLQT